MSLVNTLQTNKVISTDNLVLFIYTENTLRIPSLVSQLNIPILSALPRHTCHPAPETADKGASFHIQNAVNKLEKRS